MIDIRSSAGIRRTRKARVNSPWRLLCAVLTLSPAWVLAQTGVPGFDFNFAPIPGATQGNLPNAICNIPGRADFSCATTYRFSADRTTSFIQETVDLGGQRYYHLVVGQPDQGFAQEILIKAGGIVFFGETLSDSGGGPNSNGRDPLGAFSLTGNGSGNPQSVLIRQVMSDPAGGFSQEFLKAQLDKKPVISQNMNADGVANVFIMDMSNSDYKTSATGKMTNTTDVEGVGMWDADKGFGNSSEQTGKRVNGGRYVFNGVSKVMSDPKVPDQAWYYGTYTYYDDATDPSKGTVFDFNEANWGVPTDPAQNRPVPPP